MRKRSQVRIRVARLWPETCLGVVKYENELTVLVAEADGDDKHRNTGKHRNQDKTSFRA